MKFFRNRCQDECNMLKDIYDRMMKVLPERNEFFIKLAEYSLEDMEEFERIWKMKEANEDADVKLDEEGVHKLAHSLSLSMYKVKHMHERLTKLAGIIEGQGVWQAIKQIEKHEPGAFKAVDMDLHE